MGSLKAFCGIALAGLLLSGCKYGSSAPSPSSTAASQPVTASAPAPTTSPPADPPPTSSPPPTSPPPTTPPPTTPPPASKGTATLTWSAPTTNTNGSALTDLAGYSIHYGTSAGSLTNTINIQNPGTTTYTVTNLSAGTWYFAISAYTNTGMDSALSNVGSKTID